MIFLRIYAILRQYEVKLDTGEQGSCDSADPVDYLLKKIRFLIRDYSHRQPNRKLVSSLLFNGCFPGIECLCIALY